MILKPFLVRNFFPNFVRSFSSPNQTVEYLNPKNSRELIINFKNIPPKPKLPRTPAAIYLHERYTEMKKDDPSIKKADIKKTIESEWSQLEAKQPYQELAYKELKNYKEKKAAYDEFANRKITIGQMLNFLVEYKKFENQKNKEKLKNRPKKPQSAYHLFMKSAFTSENESEKKLSQISSMWKNLPENEKEVFVKKAEELKKLYEKELKQWKQDYA